MYDSIFEDMERSGIVDHVLLVIGILVPLLLALDYRFRRHLHHTPRERRLRILIGVGAPAFYLLWLCYNAIVDYYGLSSVFGLVMNLILFLLFGGAFILLDVYLRGGLRGLIKDDDETGEDIAIPTAEAAAPIKAEELIPESEKASRIDTKDLIPQNEAASKIECDDTPAESEAAESTAPEAPDNTDKNETNNDREN